MEKEFKAYTHFETYEGEITHFQLCLDRGETNPPCIEFDCTTFKTPMPTKEAEGLANPVHCAHSLVTDVRHLLPFGEAATMVVWDRPDERREEVSSWIQTNGSLDSFYAVFYSEVDCLKDTLIEAVNAGKIEYEGSWSILSWAEKFLLLGTPLINKHQLMYRIAREVSRL